MKAARKTKLIKITVSLSVLMVAALLIMYALRENINLFYTPEQVAKGEAPKDVMVRLGGMVVKNSVVRTANSLKVKFTLTDFKSSVDVVYDGILPALFREGQGIVARGRLKGKTIFEADEVLAKHDANYMPPEVKQSLAKE